VLAAGLVLLAACKPQAPGSHPAASAPTPPPAPKVFPPKDAVALKPGELIDWDGKTKTYAIDGWTVTLTTIEPDKGEVHPVLTVIDDQGRKASTTGEAGFSNNQVRFGAGRIDPRGDGDQFVLTSYTGGAHCCTKVQVLDRVSGQWKILDLGTWDGDGADFPAPQVKGSPPAFLFHDQRFAYAFTDYADSWMPPRLFEVTNGRVIETSQAKRYAPLYEKDVTEAKAACLKHDNPNGACAAMVADGARLGRYDEYWGWMLSNFDRKFEWTLGTACKVRTSGQCPQDKQITLDFPAALELALVDDGYITASHATFETSQPQWPTFNCAKVTSANLKLVCATRELVFADHDLAFEYARAMADSSDPDGLRASQEAFDKQVVDAPHDARAIGRLYAQRIAQLQRM
jgi:hypothetical protein